MQLTASRPVFRRFVGAVTAGMALAVTSGCTVPIDAVVGISVTADGRLLGVMMVCGHQIDGTTLYVDSDDVRTRSRDALRVHGRGDPGGGGGRSHHLDP
ncbi:hypothetical protein SALBM311S_06863 [Streptomyces alboniger]